MFVRAAVAGVLFGVTGGIRGGRGDGFSGGFFLCGSANPWEVSEIYV